MNNLQRKLQEWGLRYLPAELIGTICTLVAGSLAYQATNSLVASAVAGTWGENLGFYGTMVVREVVEQWQYHTQDRSSGWVWPVAYKTIRNVLLEFGAAGILDSLLLRPFFMWLAPQGTGNILSGLVVGKLLGDVFFYIPTIVSYEIKKRLFSVENKGVSNERPA